MAASAFFASSKVKHRTIYMMCWSSLLSVSDLSQRCSSHLSNIDNNTTTSDDNVSHRSKWKNPWLEINLEFISQQCFPSCSFISVCSLIAFICSHWKSSLSVFPLLIFSSTADQWFSKSQCTQKEFANHMDINCNANEYILIGWSHYGTKKQGRNSPTTKKEDQQQR